MMQDEFLFLLVLSFLMFFVAMFRKGVQSMMFFVMAAVFFVITAACSLSVDVVVGGEIVRYGGSAIFGIISITFAMISGGLCISKLDEVIEV